MHKMIRWFTLLFLMALTTGPHELSAQEYCSGLTFWLQGETKENCGFLSLPTAPMSITQEWKIQGLLIPIGGQPVTVYSEIEALLRGKGQCGLQESGGADCPPRFEEPQTNDAGIFHGWTLRVTHRGCFIPFLSCICYNNGSASVYKQIPKKTCSEEPEAEGGDIESPILISVNDRVFDLTDPSRGVQFDVDADGSVERVSWTEGDSDEGFLVLDRSGNGLIDNGRELFGTVTPQPVCANPNGFAALALFDDPKNGGNSDGLISKEDLIFPALRIWFDTNHDGVSQPTELHSLTALKIVGIDLDYSESRRIDRFGNQFRYRSKVYFSDGKERFAYDVFLKVI
jgi:hypothetical protein